MDEKRKTSNLIFSIVFVCFLLLIGISATYAFFSRRVESNGEETKANVITGVLDIDFETSEYIQNSKTHLVNDEEIFTEADKTVFTVKRAETSTVDNVNYNLYLDILSISKNFKSEYLKWSLYDTESPTSESTPIASGDFKELGDSTRIQLTPKEVDLPKTDTHNYTLYIWLSYSDTELQNELLSNELTTSKISAKVTTWAVTY